MSEEAEVFKQWLSSPHDVIQRLYINQQYPDAAKFCQIVTSEFTKTFNDDKKLQAIPSLNHVPLHNLKENTLVRFRCMIQDGGEVDFYLASYETVDQVSQNRSIFTGFGKDVLVCDPNQEIDWESSGNNRHDRVSYYCISVPAETKWVQEEYAAASGNSSIDSSSSSNTTTTASKGKHSREDPEDIANASATDSLKRMRVVEGSDINSPSREKPLPKLNFPLPGSEGKACIIRMYGTQEQNIKLNDGVEVYGILSLDTAVNESTDDDMEGILGEEVGVEEFEAWNPPSSLIPRVHAILIKPLGHNNPILPHFSSPEYANMAKDIRNKAEEIHNELHAILTRSLLGDELAAHYLLAYLVSSVYSRMDVAAFGRFCLNLSNIPVRKDYISGLCNLITNITTKTHVLPMSLDNLNSMTFVPKKDYTTNRLVSGVLQLTNHTNLILDETSLTVGQLNNQGVQNMKALFDVINFQQLGYDFQFNKIDFQTDIALLVLSEGKSILPSDFRVPLKPSKIATAEDIESCFASIDDSLLNKIRRYLTVVKLSDYTLPENIGKMVQDDFVHMRSIDKSVNADVLHRLMVLYRYISLSIGESSPSIQSWELTKTLEANREERINELENSSSK